MGKPRYKKKRGEQVSRKFKIIVEQFICGHKDLTHSYTPFLIEIEYLAEYVLRKTDIKILNLNKITLTKETGSNLGKLLNGSQINQIHIQIKGDVEMAFIREMKQIERYYFSNSKIRLDKIESLANSLNKSLTAIDISDSNITDDGLRIILRVLMGKMKEARKFCYNLKWNHSSDLNALGLDELISCVESHELKVHNNHFESNSIEIDNFSKLNSYLEISVKCYKIKTDSIKLFFNRHKSQDFFVEEHKPDCLLIMSMIDVMKDCPMKFKINYNLENFIGQEKVNKIMDELIKTDLTDLEINIPGVNSDSFDIIFDKVRKMKLERLSLYRMEMINFNSQTVIELFQLPELNCLSVDYCRLNYKIKKQLICKLGHNKLEKFSIIGSYFGNKLAHLISKSLIGSNLTNVKLSDCDIYCNQVKIIAESLKNTNITSINLTYNKIKNAGVKAIANVVGQTKLNTLILEWNKFDHRGAIELLKSVQKTKITICSIKNFNNNIDETYEAIANVLKDNKILLKCIEKGKNDEIDEYFERNNNSLEKAKLIINKFQKGTISYHYKYKEYFEAYELFVDTDILWIGINDKRTMKLKLENKIKDNYRKICGIVNEKLELNENTKIHTNVLNLSLEILNKICSFLSLSDVIS